MHVSGRVVRVEPTTPAGPGGIAIEFEELDALFQAGQEF